MKWTGGSKDSLAKKPRGGGFSRRGQDSKRNLGNDVFFTGTTAEKDLRMAPPVSTSKRINSNLLSISEWTKAAGLTVPLCVQAGSAVQDCEKSSKLGQPRANLKLLVSPEELLSNKLQNHSSDDGSQDKEMAGESVRTDQAQFGGRIKFATPSRNSISTPSHVPQFPISTKLFNSFDSDHVVREPPSMNPPFKSLPPDEAIKPQDTKDGFNAKEILNLRVCFSPSQDRKFFAELDPKRIKPKRVIDAEPQPVLFWNEGRPAVFLTKVGEIETKQLER